MSIPPALFGESCLIVAAHPDDEVIGMGGMLQTLPQASVLHVTDGAPRTGYPARYESAAAFAEARHGEALAALDLAGLGPDRLFTLDIADTEASAHLADLAWRIAAFIGNAEAETIVTHPYEGGHPDHDAACFAVHAARGLLRCDGAAVPRIVEMASYHNEGGRLTPGIFLPSAETITELPLDEAAQRLKRRMMLCHESQRETLALFSVDVERFRPAPRYDFTRPPHEGTLLYELFREPSMNAARWCALAGEALAELGLDAAGDPA